MMNLYSYVVADDTGFAPNPFYGYCTLATCKPDIRGKEEREGAEIGDWVIGSGSADKEKKQGGKLVYAMQVTEILTFGQYFKDERFCNKKPKLDSRKQQRGDNIYKPESGDSYQQLPSLHSNKDGSRNQKKFDEDMESKNVLISNHYVYFGVDGPLIPALKDDDGKSLLRKGRNCKKFSTPKDEQMIEKFLVWINGIGLKGCVGCPYDWSDKCDWDGESCSWKPPGC